MIRTYSGLEEIARRQLILSLQKKERVQRA